MEVPRLDPSELYDKRRSKDAARLKAYNTILTQIYNRIRVVSKINNSPCHLLYNIPPFILGLPPLDIEDCSTYLAFQLRHAGYEVRYTPPNLLFLSWAHHERTYFTESCPIVGAMMESAERTRAEVERKEREAARMLPPRKSGRKVQFASPGSMAARPKAAPAARPPSAAIASVLGRPVAAGPPPPSAADYVPPPNFLQSMSQPANTVPPQARSAVEYFR